MKIYDMALPKGTSSDQENSCDMEGCSAPLFRHACSEPTVREMKTLVL